MAEEYVGDVGATAYTAVDLRNMFLPPKISLTRHVRSSCLPSTSKQHVDVLQVVQTNWRSQAWLTSPALRLLSVWTHASCFTSQRERLIC